MATPESLRCSKCGGFPMHGSNPLAFRIRSPSSSAHSSRGEAGCSFLELEAVAAMHELSFAVLSICVSEMLPRTDDIIFVNVKTLEGQTYCLELTRKGWRVTSLRTDCMIGDFTQFEMFVHYYDSLFALLDNVSPLVREKRMTMENEDCLPVARQLTPLPSPPMPIASR